MSSTSALINTESDARAWAEAIAHSPCLRVETFGGVEQGLADVREAGREDDGEVYLESMTGTQP